MFYSKCMLTVIPGKVTYKNINSNKAIVNMFASAQRAKRSGNTEMLSYRRIIES